MYGSCMNNQKTKMSILVPIFCQLRTVVALRICISYVRALSVDVLMFGTTLWMYMSSLDSRSTPYFVRARYNNKAITAAAAAAAAAATAAAACGCGARKEGGGIRCGAGVDSAEPRGVFVCSICVVSCHNLAAYDTNEERRTNAMSGATAFENQPHSRDLLLQSVSNGL